MTYEIITISCVSLLITNFTPFVSEIKRKYQLQSIKPLDCALCLSFWFGLAYCVYIQRLDLSYIFIPPVLSIAVLKWIQSL